MKNQRANIVLEWTFLIAMVAASLVTMQYFMRTKIQGNLKNSSDEFAGSELYEPGLSRENVGNIRFVSPTIKTDLEIDGSSETTFNTAVVGGIQEIPSWGTY